MADAASIPADQGDWIARKVLTRTYLTSCGRVQLVRLCACQYGRCGYCGLGKHHKCATRVGFAGRPPARPHTHLFGRTGGALTQVWTTGQPCRWVCPCIECDQTTSAAEEPPSVAHHRARGDRRRGDTVWLTPKTLACPSICWTQPRGTVVAVQTPYALVQVGRRQYRIHMDNTGRTDPATGKSVITVRRRPRLSTPDGFTEQTLF